MAVILEKLKSKAFWAVFAGTLAGYLSGAYALPEALVKILTSLIGG